MTTTKSKSNQQSLIQDSFLQQQIYTYTVQCTLNFSENLFFHTFEAGSAPIYFSSYLHPRVVEAIRVSIQQIYNQIIFISRKFIFSSDNHSLEQNSSEINEGYAFQFVPEFSKMNRKHRFPIRVIQFSFFYGDLSSLFFDVSYYKRKYLSRRICYAGHGSFNPYIISNKEAHLTLLYAKQNQQPFQKS